MVITLRQLERLAASEREAREARIAALAQAREQVERANAELEQRVLERTADLEASNRRLVATAEKLRQSNRELQDFAYVASHDLQEPLRKVQAFGSRLETRFSAGLQDDGLDYLHRMQGAAQRMSVLIDDLLTFSRVASRAEGFRAVDLTQIAREVVSDLEVRIDESNATVDVAPLPCVEADPTQMRQLLQNLLGNALKFAHPDRPPLVAVSAALVEGPVESFEQLEVGTFCRLQMRDNGIGFDPKYLDRIFTVFQRLHGRSEYEGSGIGLAVCRRIVERHHGLITATSTPGEGATFVVYLPMSQPEENLP
jgi:light-regulated signal transduction histidine kinase (bacteriophytochrome)